MVLTVFDPEVKLRTELATCFGTMRASEFRGRRIDCSAHFANPQRRQRMSRKTLLPTVPVAMPLLAASTALAVDVANVFTSNMVLQQDQEIPVWETAEPSERVTVSFGGQTIETNVDSDGRWTVRLDPLASSREPLTMMIAGASRIELQNVFAGKV